MFSSILLIGTIGLIFVSFTLLIIDLFSSKRHQKMPATKKFPKLTTYSLVLTLISLFLLVFVSLTTSV
jgi:hypothetical protein